MKRLACLVFLAALTAGVAYGQNRPAQSGPRGPITYATLLDRYDADGDGKITKDEYGGPAALWPRLDADEDGVFTREEFAQRAQGQGPRGLPSGRCRSA